VKAVATLLHQYIVNQLNKLVLSKIKASTKAQPRNIRLRQKKKKRFCYANRIRSQKSPKKTCSAKLERWWTSAASEVVNLQSLQNSKREPQKSAQPKMSRSRRWSTKSKRSTRNRAASSSLKRSLKAELKSKLWTGPRLRLTSMRYLARNQVVTLIILIRTYKVCRKWMLISSQPK